MRQLTQAATSKTTTKLLAALVIGINAALVLRSDSAFVKGLIIAILALTAITLVRAGLADIKRKEKRPEHEESEGPEKKRWTIFDNALLSIILLLTLTV